MSQFKKGQSGNPSGRPRGRTDKRVQLRGALEKRSDEIIKKCIALALDGDTTALRLCMERITPAIRAREMPVAVDLSAATGPVESIQALMRAVSAGEIGPSEAGTLAGVVGAQLKAREFEELEARIKRLEEIANES